MKTKKKLYCWSKYEADGIVELNTYGKNWTFYSLKKID